MTQNAHASAPVTVDDTGPIVDEAVAADNKAYKESITLTPQQITSYLLDKVGQRLTAVGTGLKDARQARKWAEGTAEIRSSAEDRLRLLYRVARSVEIIYDQEAARAFLRSTSPYLGDRAPIEAIAAYESEQALEATRFLLVP